MTSCRIDRNPDAVLGRGAGLVQLVIATSAATLEQGLPYNLCPRDPAPPPVRPDHGAAAARLPQFQGDVRLLRRGGAGRDSAGQDEANSALGAEIYLAARVIYVPVYAAGIPVLRTLVWAASIVGIVMVLLAALA